MTCCSTKWTIALSDSEIEHYKQLDHPFRDRILEAIDLEKKQMKDKDGYCPLMTKDGWCSLVQECGAEHLGFVCSDFPREHHTFGDVTEGTIGIACPVAAGYLFKSGHIEFDSGEMEDESEPEPIDYQLYDNLAALRAYLVELVQSYDGNFVSGKLYVIFRVMEKTEEIWKNGALNRETAEALIEAYRNEEILAKAFGRGNRWRRVMQTAQGFFKN